ncbi:hypothetical protein CBL_06657 [Carabus blaptoides fortunei]
MSEEGGLSVGAWFSTVLLLLRPFTASMEATYTYTRACGLALPNPAELLPPCCRFFQTREVDCVRAAAGALYSCNVYRLCSSLASARSEQSETDEQRYDLVISCSRFSSRPAAGRRSQSRQSCVCKCTVFWYLCDTRRSIVNEAHAYTPLFSSFSFQ